MSQSERRTHPPAAAACKHVLPKSSGVSMSKPGATDTTGECDSPTTTDKLYSFFKTSRDQN